MFLLDREAPHPRQDEILQCFYTRDAGAVVDEENVRVFEGDLAAGSPKTELTVVSAFFGCGEILEGIAETGEGSTDFGCEGGGVALLACTRSSFFPVAVVDEEVCSVWDG